MKSHELSKLLGQWSFIEGEVLSDSSSSATEMKPGQLISRFVKSSQGLQLAEDTATKDVSFTILQTADGKSISFKETSIEEVLERYDSDGRSFLQVNFVDGKKVLLTDRLIGFKPIALKGLDLRRLPKVVTTPDLVSVVEAIEDSLNHDKPKLDEVEVLRKVFDSVYRGAEEVGFDLTAERTWLHCISSLRGRASA